MGRGVDFSSLFSGGITITMSVHLSSQDHAVPLCEKVNWDTGVEVLEIIDVICYYIPRKRILGFSLLCIFVLLPLVS